jgi:hypothetical protein
MLRLDHLEELIIKEETKSSLEDSDEHDKYLKCNHF